MEEETAVGVELFRAGFSAGKHAGMMLLDVAGVRFLLSRE
jgi:hypothetical protein